MFKHILAGDLGNQCSLSRYLYVETSVGWFYGVPYEAKVSYTIILWSRRRRKSLKTLLRNTIMPPGISAALFPS